MIKKEDLEGQDDWFEHYRIKVDPGQEPIRIDRYLQLRMEKVSRNRIQQAIRAGAVLVNEQGTKSSYKVQASDLIRIILPTDPEAKGELEPEEIPIEVIYEDDDVLVINKAAGMVVHPGIGNHSGTLVNALLYYLSRKDLPVMPSNPDNRPGIVHRIDKDTSGLMVVAKSEYAMTHLAKQFFDHTIERTYQCLVWGAFDQKEGTIDEFIGRDPRHRKRMRVFPEKEFGKRAVTHFRVLDDFYYVSLLECRLETGRTHQIRVHLKYLGHPIFSDERYGGDDIVKGTVYTKYRQFVQNCFALCPRQALHAKSIGFIHPSSGKKMIFDSDFPSDMQAVLDKWKSYFEHRKDQ